MAAQALERLESEPIDLALMDINMPDMDGYTLTAKIKSMPQFASTAHRGRDCQCHARRPRALAGGRLRWLHPETD